MCLSKKQKDLKMLKRLILVEIQLGMWREGESGVSLVHHGRDRRAGARSNLGLQSLPVFFPGAERQNHFALKPIFPFSSCSL